MGRTYAGARVVFKKVDLQITHWISIAFSLTLSCDFATLVLSSLRSRFEAAFAPWYFLSLCLMRSKRSTYVSHVCNLVAVVADRRGSNFCGEDVVL